MVENEQNISENENLEIDNDFDTVFLATQNKHKIDGKHSLKRDVIFNGRAEEEVEDEIFETTDFKYHNDNVYHIEPGSMFEKESKYNEEYTSNKRLEEDVYTILSEKTELSFNQSRRKPNRQNFNKYYALLLNDLATNYTQCEIFCSLSYYFTDNIFNMFKLLDKKYATSIIKELTDKGFLKDLGDVNFI